MRLIKEINIKEINGIEKRYTNYKLLLDINGKNYSVAIEPKTFGKEWSHPQVRQSFTLLDLVSELVVKDEK